LIHDIWFQLPSLPPWRFFPHAWIAHSKHVICESSGHGLPARADQRDQGSLRLYPPSSLGAAIDDEASQQDACVRACVPSRLVRVESSLRSLRHDLPAAESTTPQEAAGRRDKAGVQSQTSKAKRRIGSCPRIPPCTRRVERHDTLP
jgi:hypothetical protein